MPDPHDEKRYRAIELIKKEVKDGEMAVAAAIQGVFATAWQAMGMKEFMVTLHTKKSLIRKLLDDLTEFNIELVKTLSDMDIDLIIGGGDLADTNGPMISPKQMEELVFENFKKEVKASKVPYVKHTDGNINLILEGLVGTGIHGLQSLEPTAGMDIGEVKSQYGDRLVLFGNIDCSYTLSAKSLKEVEEEVRDCIYAASAGGGHVLTSSNTIHSGVKYENYLAMIEAGRKYGRYPISQ